MLIINFFILIKQKMPDILAEIMS